MRKTIAVLLLLVSLPAVAAMSRREEKDRVAALPEAHRQFLIDVEPIMSREERQTYLALETDAQRDVFITEFWRRRDRARGFTNYAARDEYMERLVHVKENFESVFSDRGRIYLLKGPPAAVVDVDCPNFQPIQVWGYPYLEGLGHDVELLFYIPRFRREYRLWMALEGRAAAMAMSDLAVDPTALGRRKIAHCDPQVIGSAMRSMALYGLRTHTMMEPPPVDAEEASAILRSVVIADEKAPRLSAEIAIAFPSGDGAKTDAQLTILVPRAELKTTSTGIASVYTLDVIGEVLRDGKMWEKYRYRFDFPGDIADEKLPIVIDRTLRPAAYTSRVKISDPASGAQTVLVSELTVPVILSRVDGEGPPSSETIALASIREDMQSSRAKLRIVPLSENVISGLQTIDTIVSGSVHAVEFWLDGKKVATRRSPPYKLDLDFGTVPRSRRIRVVALDSHDEPITGDEVVVNTGTDPFRVRIASPRVAPKLSGPVKVEVDVRVPAGKELGGVEFYWNETRVATMFDPPFVQTVTVPRTDGVGYIRAVATLKDPEIDPVEDVVMVNTPASMETLDVHLVELPTTVTISGKPVNGLSESAFKVLDEGQPVKIARFEHVKDLPLAIGMAVDTSGSMEMRMATARDAGAAFFQNVLRKGDKAFLVAFDSQPHLVQQWSPNLKEIHSGLAKMRAEERTALYDAIVYALYNFLGVKGQKALVLVTDGKDTVSKFTFEQTLEYAQRAAVPVYSIGIGIRGLDVKGKLNRITSETGGSSYYIDSADELSQIYADIHNELRSQYVLGFYPSVKPGGKWRELTVKVAEGKVKTIRGYYP
ncbi:MAG TPA: VWA domain-containing protein [Thermoanaerobaculia bacterium]|nr:VWA domain-containing protein [Thermoanaerobaculia bacterium]